AFGLVGARPIGPIKPMIGRIGPIGPIFSLQQRSVISMHSTSPECPGCVPLRSSYPSDALAPKSYVEFLCVFRLMLLLAHSRLLSTDEYPRASHPQETTFPGKDAEAEASTPVRGNPRRTGAIGMTQKRRRWREHHDILHNQALVRWDGRRGDD